MKFFFFSIKFLDGAVLFICLGITVFSAFWAYAKPQNNVYVNIRGHNNKVWVFPLDAEETVSVSGPLGDTVVEIHSGGVKVQSSPCKNQSCVAIGSIHRAGQWTACLPNDALVTIEGGNGGEKLDATVW